MKKINFVGSLFLNSKIGNFLKTKKKGDRGDFYLSSTA